jgi:2-polyprenyl-6-methoxyphenol hydroxylase-like FAD-dependent oxidoreductase
VDRVKRWYAPGILFLGDAAHTMSPSGGQGLNVAMRDTFVAANHLIPLLQKGTVPDEEVFGQIQKDREREIARLQASQTRAGQMVLKPRPILHVMCSMLALFTPIIAKKMAALPSVPIPEPRFLTPVAPSALQSRAS